MPTTSTRPHRTLRMGKRVLQVSVTCLAVVGAISLASDESGVGAFRSVAGARAYRDAYDRALQLLPAPRTTTDVTTSYGTVRAHRWESATTRGRTPVLLLPGRTSGSPMWVENLAGIAAIRPVIAVDALGDAGLSVQSAPITSMADQAAWLDEVVTELAPDGVHLVGHSFGAATAAAYARAHPQRVRTLTLLEPVFVLGYPPARVFGLATLTTLPLMPESIRQWSLEQIGGGAPADPDDPTAQMIALGARHYRADLPTPDLLTDSDLGALTMPTYVALAGRDSLAGGESAAERARQLPHATVKVWPGTTHSLPLEVPDALLGDLRTLWDA